MVLGSEDSGGLRWSGLTGTRGRLDSRTLRSALPGTAGLAVLSWDAGDVLAWLKANPRA